MLEGLVGGEGFAIDARVIKADANRESFPRNKSERASMGTHVFFLRRLRIRQRLGVGFGLFALLLVAMAAVGAWRLADQDAIAHELGTVNVQMESLVGEWLAETKTNMVRAVVLTQSDDDALHRMLEPPLEAATPHVNELAHKIESLLATERAKQLFQEIAATRKEYHRIRLGIYDRRKAEGSAAVAQEMEHDLAPAADKYLAAIEALRAYYSADVQKNIRQAAVSAEVGRNMLAGFCAAGLVLAVLGAWVITHSITRPIDGAVRTVERVAEGDLSVQVQVHGDDEVARLLAGMATMTSRLRELVGEVAAGARAVADTSAQIAQGNTDLSQRTEEQASTLEETASSMEELTSTVAQNAQGASAANQLASGARALAQEGGEAVAQVVHTMAAIAASSKKITEITGVVDSIAFQTNILALNAAVEAARAGDQGRGFAVVASEVRTLAQRSAAAAREIKALITDSAPHVDAGSQQADSAGRKMQAIVEAIVKVSEVFAGIAAASAEQSSGIEQVNNAVAQMEQVVQQNAALVEEGAAATNSLSQQASALLELVNRFELGAGHPDPEPPSIAWAGPRALAA
jgi:methyl-accepting chemotaxis protein